MNKRKLFVLAILALVLLLGALAVEGAEQQRHPNYPVTFVYTWVQTLDPGLSWVDRSGVWHIRGRLDYGLISGAIEGAAYVDYNADLKLADLAGLSGSDRPILPGDGEAFGAMTITRDGDKLPLWSGDWLYKIENGLVVDGELRAFDPGRNLLLNITSVIEGEAMGLIHTGTIDHFCGDLERACR